MKRILIILFVLGSCITCACAQGVIYTCNSTGAWGNGFNERGEPVTMKECDDVALESCKTNHGKNCKLFYKSTKGGWWGFIASVDIHGKLYFEVSDGNVTQAAAERSVRKKYKDHGGPFPENTEVKSWYVYSNLKK